MKKTIGIVVEGPRDYDMITQLITVITGEEHNYILLPYGWEELDGVS